MLEVAVPLLSPGVKGFFETSAFLIGTPLLILGGIGALIALTPFEIRWPVRQPTAGVEEAQEDVSVEGYPGPGTYIRVGIILAVVTAVEVVLYYLDIAYGALLGLLLALSLMKFLLVVLWFMHLQFDSRLFSTLFAGGMMLVIALFFVVLATLGASLI
jgi:cytochrome c oxidase subunit 4